MIKKTFKLLIAISFVIILSYPIETHADHFIPEDNSSKEIIAIKQEIYGYISQGNLYCDGVGSILCATIDLQKDKNKIE